jgi:hypothetical protein
MRVRIPAILAFMILCLTTDAGSADAAPPGCPPTAVVSPPKAETHPQGGAVAPGRGPQSGGSRSGYVGPTANITAVANGLGVQAKSLNTLVTVTPGLTLTKPVTITVAYFTPAGEKDRKTSVYCQSIGNRFLYSDPVADGQPRTIHLDISLTEPKLGGGAYSFNVPMDFSLEPLYDVAIGPLDFKLTKGCANVGANQISLQWIPPDVGYNGEFPTVNFKTKENETFHIREFAWARREVGASKRFHPVVVGYGETGIHAVPGFAPRLDAGKENLVPGKAHTSHNEEVPSTGLTPDCRATLDYEVTYQLRAYFGAPTVRVH